MCDLDVMGDPSKLNEYEEKDKNVVLTHYVVTILVSGNIHVICVVLHVISVVCLV